jgi:phosphinothricin acetyltransferase
LNSSGVSIRACQERDVPAIAAIYHHHVFNSPATFELEPPGVEEMMARRTRLLEKGFPYLVAERGGEVIGYAYAGPYRTRPAYRFTVENSVYVHPGNLRQGVGQLLMTALLAECAQKGFRQVIAVIGDSANHASIRLHEKLGFYLVGTLRSVGFKFDRWYDSVLMQRELDGDDRRVLRRTNPP